MKSSRELLGLPEYPWHAALLHPHAEAQWHIIQLDIIPQDHVHKEAYIEGKTKCGLTPPDSEAIAWREVDPRERYICRRCLRSW